MALRLLLSAAYLVAAESLATLLPHEADLPFLEVAVAVEAIRVTSSLRHYPERACRGVTLVSPGELLEMLLRHHAEGQTGRASALPPLRRHPSLHYAEAPE